MTEPSPDRLFNISSINVPGAPVMGAQAIVCSRCGAQDKIADRKHLPDDVLIKKFSARGWAVSTRNRGRHLCPACSETKSKVIPMRKTDDGAPAVAEPPREMSRDDRRIIFARLADVYLDETRGYDSGWTDHRVAEDLGVPRAWVEKIREENFGPERSNEDARQAVAEARTIAAEARQHHAALAVAQADAKALAARVARIAQDSAPLALSVERLTKRLDVIAKSLGLV
jgi:hypothetical protein